ncbi:MAG: AAA domain-containing protein, partial [Candidatus Dadabacteria bacterium]|nr:AAA domain-containing protein [Candidatus Dadabacteria bacterium]
GDLTIVKEDTELGERIKQDIVKGGILTSEICLLDDISRAPGESLNILLRILNERKFFSEPIPLLTAIATSNPTADEYYNEPLDPANLDRFILQVKALGISYGRKWDEAKKVIELYAEKPFEEKIPKRVSKKLFDKSYKTLEKIPIPPEVQEGLANFAAIMIEDFGLNETNSLITDRTFFVKALKLIRSHALLNEREVCSREDLDVLRYMTAFRVPPDVYEQMDNILRNIVQDKKKSQMTS